MFNSLLLISLIIFFIGLIYRVSQWFTKSLGNPEHVGSTSQRIGAAVKGILMAFFSARLVIVLKALLVDVLLQVRIFRENKIRWLAHMLIFYGFMLLLLMHALDSLVTAALFDDYYATVNPFFFLRDFFGVMVLAGVAMAACRRYFLKPRRLRTGPRDHYAIIIIAVVMFSGIALEGLKITSHGEFMIMVEDYAGLDDEDEIQALESVWVIEHGLVSPNIKPPFDEDLLEAGREVHEGNCLDCHAPAQWAFTSFGVAMAIRPVAIWLDQVGGVTILWYIHIIACFAGLAYLPFSKMFHIFCTPISLIAGQVMDPRLSAPQNIMTRQIMELDACTHCGSCSLNCSAGMIYEAIGNEYVLPSEKMSYLKRMTAGRELDQDEMMAIQEGVYLCTNCDRCTVRCPSGIQLKELWYTVREELIAKGPPTYTVLTPFSFVRGLLNRGQIAAEVFNRPVDEALGKVTAAVAEWKNQETPIPLNILAAEDLPTPGKDETFSHCFGCRSCTTVCPVVANYEQPEEQLGLLPHQIMCCLGLGMNRIASGAKMIWNCLTCYQCQENCPQQVDVCDLMFGLKNEAAGEG